MVEIARRAALAGAATLASALTLRKPVAQTIITLQPAPPTHLLGMEAMTPTVPPAPFPQQAFTDAEGKPAGISQFSGKGVVLNLWATWCVPCVAEMPALDALAQHLAAHDIVVVPISSDRGGAPVVQRFYAAHGIAHLGIWLDPKGVAGSGWGVRGLPTTIVLDRNGLERGRLEGGAAWSTDAALDEIVRMCS